MAKQITVQLDGYTFYDDVITQLPAIHNFKAGETVVLDIDYSCGTYMDCNVYALLCAYFHGLRNNGVTVRVLFDTAQKCDTVDYAGRIGFFNHLSVDYKYPYQERDPGGRFLPLTQTGTMPTGIGEKATEIISQKLDIPDSFQRPLLFALDELVCNIAQHSGCPSGGFAYAQYFPTKGELVFNVVDSGVGIFKTFQNSKTLEHRSFPEEQAMREALNKQVTTGNGRGHGLFLISQLISHNLGDFRLISGNFTTSINNGTISVRKSSYWQGVALLCTFYTKNPVDMRRLFEENGFDTLDELW